MTSFNSYEGLKEWASSLPTNEIIADETATQSLVLALAGLCRADLDGHALSCLRWLEQTAPGWVADGNAVPGWNEVKGRLNEERWENGHLPPTQARNRLVFAAGCKPSSLDWQLAEYLAGWVEDAGVPFLDAMAAFKRHVPSLSS